VAYLHDRGVVHRDLKPENILLQSKADDINVKLVDFGVATEQTTSKTFCGSMSYLAPEVLRRRGSLLGQGTYGKGVDMWSVGVICHVVLSLRPPFDEEEEASMHKSICDVLRFAGPEWARVSPAAKDFVSKCLEISEGKRLFVFTPVSVAALTPRAARRRPRSATRGWLMRVCSVALFEEEPVQLAPPPTARSPSLCRLLHLERALKRVAAHRAALFRLVARRQRGQALVAQTKVALAGRVSSSGDACVRPHTHTHARARSGGRTAHHRA